MLVIKIPQLTVISRSQEEEDSTGNGFRFENKIRVAHNQKQWPLECRVAT